MVDGSRALAFFGQLPKAYRVGLIVMAAGVLVILLGSVLGNLFFLALSGMLDLFGVPEERGLLSPSNHKAGTQLLSLLGSATLLCGAIIAGFRWLMEIPVFGGRSAIYDRLGWLDRVGVGVVLVGVAFLIIVTVGEFVLSEVSRDYYGSRLGTSMLSIVARIGSGLLLCGLLLLILGGPRRRRALLRWTNRKGWGKIGCGWINKLGIGLMGFGLLTLLLGLPESMGIIVVAGAIIILLGLTFHFIGVRTP